MLLKNTIKTVVHTFSLVCILPSFLRLLSNWQDQNMWVTEHVLIVKRFQLCNLTYCYRQLHGLHWLFLIYLVSLFLHLFWRLLRFWLI